MFFRKCNISRSNKVGFLSKLATGFFSESKVSGRRLPWFGNIPTLENSVFVLDNDDTLVLDNDDIFEVRAEV